MRQRSNSCVPGTQPTGPTPSLYELALEYEQAAQLQQEAIVHLRGRYNAIRRKAGSKEAQRLYSLLQLYYTQRRELLQTSAYLRHYYRLSSNPPAGAPQAEKTEGSAQVA